MSQIIDRILRDMEEPELIEKLAALSASDLHSLLMALASRKAEALSPQELLRNYKKNAYAHPAATNAVSYHALEASLLEKAEAEGFRPYLLSPAAPFGSCAAVASVSQNKILSSLRHGELLSDPTNMLALILAEYRQAHGFGEDIHACTTHRIVRVLPHFTNKMLPHFGIFCAVSAGRDRGSYSFERAALQKHIQLYKALLEASDVQWTLCLSPRKGYTDGAGFFRAMRETAASLVGDIEEGEATDNAYYQGLVGKIYITDEEGRLELGDLGFVDWTQALTGNRKERFLISACSLDRFPAAKG